MPCGHHAYRRARRDRTPDRSALAIREVPDGSAVHANCGKACHYPGSSEVIVDAAFWANASDITRAGVLAHELAHAEGVACEACADYRAGEIMRGWGFSQRATARAFQHVQSRPFAHLDASSGWRRIPW